VRLSNLELRDSGSVKACCEFKFLDTCRLLFRTCVLYNGRCGEAPGVVGLGVGAVLGILSLPLLSSATKRSLKLPPGPNGFPILGYLPFMGDRPHFTLAKLAQKYGPVMYIQMGSFDGGLLNLLVCLFIYI
jgi:hypothetical protein